MVDYNVVKYCRMCKKRFVVEKKKSKTHYCSGCQEKFYANKD